MIFQEKNKENWRNLFPSYSPVNILLDFDRQDPKEQCGHINVPLAFPRESGDSEVYPDQEKLLKTHLKQKAKELKGTE